MSNNETNDWNIAEEHIRALKASGKKIQNGLKISRSKYKMLSNSFIYVGDKLYQMSRTSVGKLGEGVFGMAKIVKDKQGNVSVVKIEHSWGNTAFVLRKKETAIMTRLGRNLGTFQRKSNTNKKNKRNKKYLVMPLVKGITLYEFLKKIE